MIYDYKIVNCDKAIEILQKMKQEKETCCCKHGNPCLGCADYSEETDTCKSHGGCGAKMDEEIEGKSKK